MYNIVFVSFFCSTLKILLSFFFLYSFPFLTSNVSICFCNFLSLIFPCKHSKIFFVLFLIHASFLKVHLHFYVFYSPYILFQNHKGLFLILNELFCLSMNFPFSLTMLMLDDLLLL